MKKSGFSLLVILITMAILGILISLSYPLYVQHIIKTRRLEAKTTLYALAESLEQFYTENMTYNPVTLKQLGFDKFTLQGFYSLDIELQQDGYLLKAIPQGIQAIQDKKCGILTLNSLGKTNISGTATINECWH
ncbi:MAG: hypothetical protein LEGION0398_MBIBDBAK_00384 [Legionellaceae bacterium]